MQKFNYKSFLIPVIISILFITASIKLPIQHIKIALFVLLIIGVIRIPKLMKIQSDGTNLDPEFISYIISLVALTVRFILTF